MSTDKILSSAANVLSKGKFHAPYSSIGGFTTNMYDIDSAQRSGHGDRSSVFTDRDVDGFHAQGEIAMLDLLQFDSQATYHKISEKDKCILYECVSDDIYTVKGVSTVFTHLSEVMDLLCSRDPYFTSILAKLLGPIHADNKTLYPHESICNDSVDDEHALLVSWLALQASSSAAVNNDLASSGHLRNKVSSAQNITKEFCFLRYSGYYTLSDSRAIQRVLPNEPLNAESQAVSVWESLHNVPVNIMQHTGLLGRFVKTGFILEQAKAPNAVRVNFIMSSDHSIHTRQGASEKLFLQRMVRTILLNMSAAIMELRLSRDHLLLKHSWTDSAMCTICLKNFSFMRRKHHCRLCGDAFCTTCSLSHHRPGLGDTVRVCHACVEGNPSSMVRSSEKLFSLNRPSQMFRHSSMHNGGNSNKSQSVSRTWGSTWSHSARGKSPTRHKQDQPSYHPTSTIHLSDNPPKELRQDQQRKKSAPQDRKKPPISPKIASLERKKSAPMEPVHKQSNTEQYDTRFQEHHGASGRFHSMPDDSGRYMPNRKKNFDERYQHTNSSPTLNVNNAEYDERYRAKSPKFQPTYDEVRFRSPIGKDNFNNVDGDGHFHSPQAVYEENVRFNPKSPRQPPNYRSSHGYVHGSRKFGDDSGSYNTTGNNRNDERDYDPPIHLYPEPMPEPVMHPHVPSRVYEDSEYLYQSTPFYYPLNFHNGNPWPDAPVTEYEMERLERARKLDLLRRRDDILMYARIAAKTMNCPVATICIVGGQAGLLIAKVGGVTTDTIPRSVMLESHAIMSIEPTVVLDCSHDLRFATNPLVCEGDVGIRFYVGIPLCTSDGLILGVLSLVDTVPRDRVRRSELGNLRQVAETIMNRFEDIAITEKKDFFDEYQRQYEMDFELD